MSTGIVAWFAAKSRTTSAVLGPIPGSSVSVFLASLKGNDKMGVSEQLYFSRIVFAVFCIVFVLLWYRPATRMQSSIFFVSAFDSAWGVISKCFERFSKALAVLMSAVFCEMIVTTKVSNGSISDLAHLGMVILFSSISRIFAARVSVVIVLPSSVSKRMSKYWFAKL